MTPRESGFARILTGEDASSKKLFVSVVKPHGIFAELFTAPENRASRVSNPLNIFLDKILVRTILLPLRE